MILKELYKKDITRDVNPAVSAGDLKEATIHTEIEEYVFTQEIFRASMMSSQASAKPAPVTMAYGSADTTVQVSLTSSSISTTVSRANIASVPLSASQKKCRRQPII